MERIIGKIVVSDRKPNSTDVMWVELDETGMFSDIKVFNNGEWKGLLGIDKV